MKAIKTVLLSLIIFGFFFLTSSCKQDNAVENAGEEVGEVMEDIGDAAKEVVNEAKGDGPIEEAGEFIDESIEKVKDAAEDVVK